MAVAGPSPHMVFMVRQVSYSPPVAVPALSMLAVLYARGAHPRNDQVRGRQEQTFSFEASSTRAIASPTLTRIELQGSRATGTKVKSAPSTEGRQLYFQECSAPCATLSSHSSGSLLSASRVLVYPRVAKGWPRAARKDRRRLAAWIMAHAENMISWAVRSARHGACYVS